VLLQARSSLRADKHEQACNAAQRAVRSGPTVTRPINKDRLNLKTILKRNKAEAMRDKFFIRMRTCVRAHYAGVCARANMSIGAIYSKKGQYDQAIELFDHALRIQ
jgi:hypothetical protein